MESESMLRKKLFGSKSSALQKCRDIQDHRGNNGRGSGKKKPEVSLFLLSEGVAFVLLLVFIGLLCGLVRLSLQQLLIGKSTGEFNAVRARKHLERITDVGPRPVGSVENEVLTVNYLLEQVEQIRSESIAGPHAITLDLQRPTGSFSIKNVISYYDRITNIAVRLEPKDGAQHFMLANCHFDSVANSPGASDDAVSCAVMLEVLRSLASLSSPLTHGVIFLFNGAEENVLQASHGFITQHPWAKQVKAFVNLEAAGVGGKEVVFQTGPENPWLVQAYVHAAVHPFASVVGQEIFQSGIIPSETDFRIYRDFGNIPGIDLAFIENGFLYHTKYDTADRILTDSIQRAGDNILALLKHLLMSEKLADSSEYRHGNMVFFDVLGVVAVAYPARVGTIINYMAVMATFLYLAKKNKGKCGHYLRDLALGSCVALLSWFATLLSVLIVALVLTLAGCSMFWYSHFSVAIALYGSAAAAKILLVHTLAKNLYYGGVRRVELGELFFDVSLLLWCCVLLCLTLRGLCSAYVPMLMVAFPLATKLLLSSHFRCRGASVPYAVLYLLGLTLPYVHLMFLIWVVFEIFCPILGRSGTKIPPEVVLACLVTLAIILLSSYFMHFIYLARSSRRVLTILGSLFAVMLLLVSSGLIFPYSSDPDRPRPKRIIIQHTTRTFHTLNGLVEHEDSGLWINSCDYTGMSYITPHIPEINDTIRTQRHDDLPFGGFPGKSWYLPVPAASPKSPLEFRLVSKQVTEWGTIKMSFEAKGPSHMSLYLRPNTGVSLSSWSFGNNTPQSNFIFYSHGLGAPAWHFWLEIQPPSEPSAEKGLISVAVSCHYFGEAHRTPQLDALLGRFPAWSFPSSWVSSYHMFRY
ncbi:endoplasmic reticulum metallopeptidase 1-like isoform X2 [Electrophorus electricus]|uniref:endoplasmic reticulum metallopeptidase 1-like isoform X2 n=1 Tax=Electrophorus electricus TaxID=8005 RepID=UPI0015D07317|nr:endoplasmic reticulum metallopeptidase 1-like isoform X2 [Electrophorus electricus]